ncbi:hypothetical protein [Antricoccus suffuscus]|uniref:hypothetical protein n=1 Tax=Antricoccus suffuscus TaxID=1629062 RepID=UPI0011B1D258|nr:hypothetical protein [Antricoccus suffuscus]
MTGTPDFAVEDDVTITQLPTTTSAKVPEASERTGVSAVYVTVVWPFCGSCTSSDPVVTLAMVPETPGLNGVWPDPPARVLGGLAADELPPHAVAPSSITPQTATIGIKL